MHVGIEWGPAGHHWPGGPQKGIAFLICPGGPRLLQLRRSRYPCHVTPRLGPHAPGAGRQAHHLGRRLDRDAPRGRMCSEKKFEVACRGNKRLCGGWRPSRRGDVWRRETVSYRHYSLVSGGRQPRGSGCRPPNAGLTAGGRSLPRFERNTRTGPSETQFWDTSPKPAVGQIRRSARSVSASGLRVWQPQILIRPPTPSVLRHKLDD